MTVEVRVDDNFHYMGRDAHWKFVAFALLYEALATCKAWVDSLPVDHHKIGMDAEELYCQYKIFGGDPVQSEAWGARITLAWDYANARAF